MKNKSMGHGGRRLLLLAVLTVAACDNAGPDSAAKSAPGPAALPALDSTAAATAIEALASADPSQHGKMAVAALALLEEQRLGKSFAAGLDGFRQAAPDDRETFAAKTISDNLAMLDQACAAGARETLTSMAVAPPGRRNALVWDACEFDRLGLTTKADTEQGDTTAIILAHMAFAHLQAHGEVDPRERKLLAMMCTLKAPS